MGFVSCFASRGKEEQEEIYPTTISEIVDAQQADKNLHTYFKRGGVSSKNWCKLSAVKDTTIITENGKMMIPFCLQKDIVAWYHHYLQHPGATRLEETLRVNMTWDGLRKDVCRHTESCQSCQKNKRYKIKYGKLPTKLAWTTPWKVLCVDLIGTYLHKGKYGSEVYFMCLTMMDPATNWFKIVELTIVEKPGQKASDMNVSAEYFDKMSQ